MTKYGTIHPGLEISLISNVNYIKFKLNNKFNKGDTFNLFILNSNSLNDLEKPI